MKAKKQKCGREVEISYKTMCSSVPHFANVDSEKVKMLCVGGKICGKALVMEKSCEYLMRRGNSGAGQY